ncbi:hypothetical protein [Halioxenophilus sp. WMMB6]|uniref:hypothetical protein n=1 Tax=Halioxenophilus sp. WMMB6 TaxID=3073815 RepID=UPI00295F0B45|nr:hypothetical protein [Halioxenophilus sp. WMMB6]
MADLQQILSALIRDISKARFSSDLYSRSIARYYENDYLLRRFPIPRTEIEEIEIDLKFAISDISDNSVNGEGKEANLAFVLERTTERLVSVFLEIAEEFSFKTENAELMQQIHAVLAKGFRSAEVRIEMRQNVLRMFIESYSRLITIDGEFDIEAAQSKVMRPMLFALYNHRKPEAELATNTFFELMKPICDYVQTQKQFTDIIKSLEAPIETIWDSSNDVRLGVSVGEHLHSLKDSAICSVKVRATVRNHLWSEVKRGERDIQRVLTSE